MLILDIDPESHVNDKNIYLKENTKLLKIYLGTIISVEKLRIHTLENRHFCLFHMYSTVFLVSRVHKNPGSCQKKEKKPP